MCFIYRPCFVMLEEYRPVTSVFLKESIQAKTSQTREQQMTLFEAIGENSCTDNTITKKLLHERIWGKKERKKKICSSRDEKESMERCHDDALQSIESLCELPF